MKHVIIGTAGHIDHGKTTLIKAITGRETDTLTEEKERGISINLGFTYFDLPSGRRAGIIDVPGHEKFIKNMLAGISGIDIVIMVIAADEGVMPQTREHLEILQLLNIKKGIIVLTKCDMVDDEWIVLVKEDIKEEFKGTFLENAPIHAVSSKTKAGLKDLVLDLDKMTEEVKQKDVEGHFRLPVDRVFTVSGFGTVVTGTIISGKVKVGEEVMVYPSKIKARIRGLQVHDISVDEADAGQRCAINLSNVKVNEIHRGDVISWENVLDPSYNVDTKLHYIKTESKPFENRQRIRFHHGTSEIIGRAFIIDKNSIEPGEDAYVQFRLEKKLCAQRNDRFVIRTYSPMHTIGGGIIINPSCEKTSKFDDKYIQDLKLKESGKTENILENTVKKLSSSYPNTFSILKACGKNVSNIEDKLEELVSLNKILKLSNSEEAVYIHIDFLESKIKKMNEILEEYHKKNPLKTGISKEELKNKSFSKSLKTKNFDEIIQICENRNIIDIHEIYISKHGFTVKYNNLQQKLKDKIIKIYKDADYNTPRYKELLEIEQNKDDFKMVFESLMDNNILIKTGDDCIFLKKHYDEAKDKIINYIKQNKSITPAQARDVLNTTRKYVVSILESFDNEKITKRVDNVRILKSR